MAKVYADGSAYLGEFFVPLSIEHSLGLGTSYRLELVYDADPNFGRLSLLDMTLKPTKLVWEYRTEYEAAAIKFLEVLTSADPSPIA